MFLCLCIIFSRPFAVFLIRLLIMWIPEFLMVYKIRGGRARYSRHIDINIIFHLLTG